MTSIVVSSLYSAVWTRYQVIVTNYRQMWRRRLGEAYPISYLTSGHSCLHLGSPVCAKRETEMSVSFLPLLNHRKRRTLPLLRDIVKKVPLRRRYHWTVSPQLEARRLFVVAFAPGQGIERVRKGIQVSEVERQDLLRILNPFHVRRICDYRQSILNAFDALVANPPTKILEQVRLNLERIRARGSA
jgi:hypothetical protein